MESGELWAPSRGRGDLPDLAARRRPDVSSGRGSSIILAWRRRPAGRHRGQRRRRPRLQDHARRGSPCSSRRPYEEVKEPGRRPSQGRSTPRRRGRRRGPEGRALGRARRIDAEVTVTASAPAAAERFFRPRPVRPGRLGPRRERPVPDHRRRPGQEAVELRRRDDLLPLLEEETKKAIFGPDEGPDLLGRRRGAGRPFLQQTSEQVYQLVRRIPRSTSSRTPCSFGLLLTEQRLTGST